MAPRPKTKLLSKGQVVIPKTLRDAWNWHPGAEFADDDVAEGVLLRSVRPFRPTTFDEVFGCLKYSGRPKTLRQMDRAIAKGVQERHDRGRY